MEVSLHAAGAALDQLAGGLLVPLAAWILISGADDLFVLLVFLRARRLRVRVPDDEELEAAPARRIALFVPCWKEDRVIGDMVSHNIAALRYPRYDIFVGAYPNDRATVEAVRALEERYRNVHLALCPHDGPTSKADCLNWIYQRMLLYEEEHSVRFEIVVIHDAEDMIHCDELHWINYFARDYGMVQTPVLALATPPAEFTHGLYCDDFAHCHTIDLAARQAMGGFIPSCGVGTGYTRETLEELAVAESNRIFDPSSLTEDYENGLRIHALGRRQLFVPIEMRRGAPMATREYFPRRFRDAVRQRSRWVTGIALQAWQRHGWPGRWRQRYWLFRDRKSLLSNPAGVLANLVFAYGCVTWAAAQAGGRPWGLGERLGEPWVWALLAVNGALQLIHLGARAACVARIYGWRFAAGTPLRLLYGNWLNSVATARAIWAFAGALWRKRPLVWVKTEHAYPARTALLAQKRSFEEILLGSGYLSAAELLEAKASMPAGADLAEHLVEGGWLEEEQLYEALSLRHGLPVQRIEPRQVRREVARSLPVRFAQEWKVLPVKVERGSLHLASPDPPTDELHDALRRFTRLEVRIQLVTPTNFRRLADTLL